MGRGTESVIMEPRKVNLLRLVMSVAALPSIASSFPTRRVETECQQRSKKYTRSLVCWKADVSSICKDPPKIFASCAVKRVPSIRPSLQKRGDFVENWLGKVDDGDWIETPTWGKTQFFAKGVAIDRCCLIRLVGIPWIGNFGTRVILKLSKLVNFIRLLLIPYVAN
jgi:hypothetical protein